MASLVFCPSPVPSLPSVAQQGQHGGCLEDCRYVCYHFFSFIRFKLPSSKTEPGISFLHGPYQGFSLETGCVQAEPPALPCLNNHVTLMASAGVFPGLPHIPNHCSHMVVTMQCWISRIEIHLLPYIQTLEGPMAISAQMLAFVVS